MKTLVVEMPERSYRDLEILSQNVHRTIGGLVRLGLALAKVAVTETQRQNRLVIMTRCGEPLREVVIPQE